MQHATINSLYKSSVMPSNIYTICSIIQWAFRKHPHKWPYLMLLQHQWKLVAKHQEFHRQMDLNANHLGYQAIQDTDTHPRRHRSTTLSRRLLLAQLIQLLTDFLRLRRHPQPRNKKQLGSASPKTHFHLVNVLLGCKMCRCVYLDKIPTQCVGSQCSQMFDIAIEHGQNSQSGREFYCILQICHAIHVPTQMLCAVSQHIAWNPRRMSSSLLNRFLMFAHPYKIDSVSSSPHCS